MQVFIDNKYISRALMEGERTPLESLIDFKIEDHVEDEDKEYNVFMTEAKHEKAYEELLEYLSVTGDFFLTGNKDWQDGINLMG